MYTVKAIFHLHSYYQLLQSELRKNREGEGHSVWLKKTDKCFKNIRENPSHPWSRNKTINANTSYDKKTGIQNY